MPRHILIKLTKTKYKERLLKAAREKQKVTYKGKPIYLTADLSAETLKTRRESTTKIIVPSKDLIQNRWRNKRFSDKQKLREFSTTKPALQQMLKELIWSRNIREEKKKKTLQNNPPKIKK